MRKTARIFWLLPLAVFGTLAFPGGAAASIGSPPLPRALLPGPADAATHSAPSGAPASRAPDAADGVWHESPPSDYRLWHTTVVDPARHRMIVIGGYDGAQSQSDVWAFTLGGAPQWMRLIPAGVPPPPRFLQAAVLDPARDRVLVFGGGDTDGAAWTLSNEVWALSLASPATWTQLAPQGTPPQGRLRPTMVLDAARDRVLVFGGTGIAGETNELWSLSLGDPPTWTALAPGGTPPPARAFATAVVDPARDRMILFGGDHTFAGKTQDLNDVWALSLASLAWTPLSPSGTAPDSRYGHTAILDPARDRMLVFGGYDLDASAYLGDVWSLSLAGATAWTPIAAVGPAPPQLIGATAVDDPDADAMRVFGGWGGVPASARTEVWSLGLAGTPRWIAPYALVTPPATGRFGHRVVIDAPRGRALVIGGATSWYPVGLQYLDDLWALDLVGGTWTPLVPAASGYAGRQYASAVVDPLRERVLVFGGEGATAATSEVWALSLTGEPTWSLLPVVGATFPPPRSRHVAVYDPVRDRMLVHGGYDATLASDLGDLWALSLGGTPTWTQLAPGGSAPEARHDHAAVYDPLRDRMLVIGGAAASPPYDRADVYALTLSPTLAWSALSPPPGPSGRRQHTAVIDPARDRVVVGGGMSYDGAAWHFAGDLWALSLAGAPAWTALEPLGPPEPTAAAAAAWDVARDRMLVYGGTGTLNALWEYLPAAALDAPRPVNPTAPALALAGAHPARGSARLVFTLTAGGPATLRVLDLAGRVVATLAEGTFAAGAHDARWDARLADGAPAPAGVYLAELRAADARIVRRLVVLR